MSNLTSSPWNFNIRGASITFNNVGGTSFPYYFCLIDFPSAYDFQEEVQFTFTGVTAIPNTGQYNYNPALQYLAINAQVVYNPGPENMGFYTCIADTPSPAGPFNPACWQACGANAYQLNYSYEDYGNGWPNPADGATVVSYQLPLFTTDPGYNSGMGPIMNVAVTCSGSSTALQGDPNRRKPPIVNLPVNSRNGGTTGTPVLLVFSSLTYQTGQNCWLMACVNTVNSGLKNKFTIFASYPNNIATIDPGPATNPVAAVGTFQMADLSPNPNPGIAITGFPLLPVPSPLSSNPRYYTL
ncbi:MAG: hypothetical protein ACYC1Q_03090 [Bacteroidia bacterium]